MRAARPYRGIEFQDNLDNPMGIEFYNLSHRFGYQCPNWPYFRDVQIERMHHMAKSDVLSQTITATMHVTTHIDAPAHVVQGTRWRIESVFRSHNCRRRHGSCRPRAGPSASSLRRCSPRAGQPFPSNLVQAALFGVLKEIVRQPDGVTILSDQIVGSELAERSLIAIPLKERFALRVFGMQKLENRELNLLGRRFLEVASELAPSFEIGGARMRRRLYDLTTGPSSCERPT